MSRDSPKVATSLILYLLACTGAGLLAWVGCPPEESGHSVLSWLAMSLIYLPLALGTTFFLRASRRAGLAMRIAGAAATGAVLLVFLRAQTDLIHLASQTWRSVLIWGALVAVFSLLPVPGSRSVRRDWVLAFGAMGLFLAATAVVNVLPNNVRWHLFGHQQFLGAIAVHLSDSPPSLQPQTLLKGSDLERRAPQPGESPDRRNEPMEHPAADVLLVMVDTLRADGFTFYGGATPRMPRTEEFARRSHFVTDAWTNSTWTRPSVASFLTGQLPEHLGVLDEDDRLPAGVGTLAERFTERGYETAAFVTNPHIGANWGFARGFEHFYELKSRRAYLRAEGVTRRVETWLRSRETGERPLFLYVHFMDPHLPYLSGARPFLGSFDVRAYGEELRYLDRHLAELLNGFEGRFDQTGVVIVTSDHGEELGEHGRFGHGQSVYPELTRIPLIVKIPEGGSGKLDARIEARDVFDLLTGPELTEQRLRSWAESKSDGIRNVSSYKSPRSKLIRFLRPYDVIRVRGAQYGERLVIWNGFGPTREIYDLANDPRAYRNLAPASETLDSEMARIDRSVGYWSMPVEGTIGKEELEELRALGYLQ